jgi:hypothetical protein
MGKLEIVEDDYKATMRNAVEWYEARIAEDITTSTLTYAEIAAKYGVLPSYVAQVAKMRGITRPRGSGSPAHKQHR